MGTPGADHFCFFTLFFAAWEIVLLMLIIFAFLPFFWLFALFPQFISSLFCLSLEQGFALRSQFKSTSHLNIYPHFSGVQKFLPSGPWKLERGLPAIAECACAI